MGTVCQTCGDEGFVEALVYCDACKIGAVHRYCCGITPVPIDGYVTWFCSDCEESDSGFDCNEVDQVAILMKTEKNKKVEKSSNHTPPGSDVELQYNSHVESIEVSSAPPIIETLEEPERREISGGGKSIELTALVGNEAYVLEAGDGASVSEKSEKEKKKKKKRKKKRNSICHSLSGATDVEPVEVAKKRDDSDTGKSDEFTGLASNEISDLEKSEKKKKKRNEENSNHNSLILEAEGHELKDTTNFGAMQVSKKRKSPYRRESEELNGVVRNEISVLEKNEKMKKRKTKTNKEEEKKNDERSNHTSAFLDAEDHGLQDAKHSKKHKTSDSKNSDELNGLVRNEASVLESSEKKKNTDKDEKKKHEESSDHTWPVLAVVDNGVQDTINLEPARHKKAQLPGNLLNWLV